MNWKKLLFAFAGVFVAMLALRYLIHEVILASAYGALESENIWRPREEMFSLMWVMYIGNLVFAFFFVYIFAKGYEAKGIMEGIRYGLLIAGFFVVIGNLAQYAIYPVPFSFTIYWLVFGFIEMVIYGIIAALIYKPLAKPAQ